MAGIAEAGLGTSSSLPTTVTGLPALTTTFTPPSSCTPYWSQLWPDDDGRLTKFIGDDVPITCYPSSTRPTYSPGLCPDSYVMVTITEYKPSSSGPGDERLWEASCCSSGMTWATSPFSGCMETFDTSVTAYRDQILTISTETAEDGVLEPITSHVTGDHGNSTVLTTGTMVADEVVIYWQATDLPKFDSDYASMLARRLNIDFTPTPTAAAPTTASNPNNTSKKSGLSTGAKAGIGVGVAAVVILFCIAGFLLYNKGRHRKETKTFLKNDQPELVQQARSSDATA